jgi:hypothetical protein
MQEVLEKFEFFPIKCRVQRATEAYSIAFSRAQEAMKSAPFASKVFVHSERGRHCERRYEALTH